jgi:hypothetical protein
MKSQPSSFAYLVIAFLMISYWPMAVAQSDLTGRWEGVFMGDLKAQVDFRGELTTGTKAASKCSPEHS